MAGYSKEGVSLLGISLAADKIGFPTRGVKITIDQLLRDAPAPAILHWNQNHSIVFIDSSGWRGKTIHIADPARGLVSQYQKNTKTLDDGYNTPKKDYKAFAMKYPTDGEIRLQRNKLSEMYNWCKELNVTATPTFFIKVTKPDGSLMYKLPRQYAIEDLRLRLV